MEDRTLEMEMMENENTDIVDFESEEGIGSKLGLKVGAAAVAGAVAIGLLVHKKLKAANDGKPKKRKVLRWVEVDEEDVVEVVDGEIVEEE